MDAALWPLPPDSLSLGDEDVHVWRVALDEPLPPGAAATLSPDEHERARQFRFPHLTRRFVAARAGVRAILSRYAGVDARAIRFVCNERGKPSLANDAALRLSFNVSHSEGLELCAVARRDVGVDLEYIRLDRDPFAMVEPFFSAVESASLRDVDPVVRLQACYICWTRKEAFMKACGEGLSMPIDSFDLSCAPGEPPRVLAVRAAGFEDREWTIADVDPGDGFVGAVVVEGRGLPVTRWQWPWTR